MLLAEVMPFTAILSILRELALPVNAVVGFARKPVQDRCKIGSRLVQDWFKIGSRLVQDRFKIGSRSVQDRFKIGSRPVQDSARKSNHSYWSD